jgi:type IV secretion system protein VirD4
MQLPPADELVLVSGLAPIRAKKLRYYEDGNFTARVLPAPALREGSYRDGPAPRPDDWGGQIRGPHLGLSSEAASGLPEEDEGGLQQQRHPGIDEETIIRLADADSADPLGLGDDESDAGADKRAMDRLRPLSAVARAHAVNEGDAHDDLLPSF